MDLNIIEMTNDEVKEVRDGIYATRNGNMYGVVDTIHNMVLDQAGEKSVYRDNYAFFNTGDKLKALFFEGKQVREFRGKIQDYSDKTQLVERSSIGYKVVEVVSDDNTYIVNAITGDDLIVVPNKSEMAFRPCDKIIYSVKTLDGYRVVTSDLKTGKLEDILNELYKSVTKLKGKQKGFEVEDETGKKMKLTVFGQFY